VDVTLFCHFYVLSYTPNMAHDPTVLPLQHGHYSTAIIALTAMVLGCFGARDNTAPALQRRMLRHTPSNKILNCCTQTTATSNCYYVL